MNLEVRVEKNKTELCWFGHAGRLVADALGIIEEGCTRAHQLLHPSDCVVSMAQGVRQPVHSITSLAVPIETDGNASAAGTQKEREGRTGCWGRGD